MNAKGLLKFGYRQVLLVFVAFLAMVLVSYFYVSSIVRQQVKVIGDATMDATMDATQTAVSAGLTESELWVGNVVQSLKTMVSSGRTNAELLQFLYETQDYFNAERSPLRDFMKVYGYIRGDWFDGARWTPPPGYVPEQRPWHIGAVANNGRIFFSEPYVDAQTGGMCISFSQELRDQNKVPYGVLAVDLKLATVTEHIRKQNIAGNGYGVLVDDRMHFTVHRNTELIGRQMARAGGDYGRLADMLAREEQISAARFNDADGTDSVVFFRKIFNGWHIGIIIPRTSYYHEVYALAAVLAVMGFLLASALSYLLVRTRVEKLRSDEENLSKSSFLARMSHEMRTPMNAIIGTASDEEEAGALGAPAERGPVFAGKRILLAEDVDINREILLTLLEDTGVVVDCAVNGREAVRMFAANPDAYDLIFMDIHMPEMDGYDATKAIRRLKRGRSATVPIVAMTANVFREDVEKCLAAGMNDHVGKPLEPAELMSKMKAWCDSTN
ncbi:MAG: response regulator [Desulfovibrio sp.]|nr:response regulator [Desulfovibrio sp.]